jgi:antitoxin ParD1/3/4
MLVPIFGKSIGGSLMARNTSISLGDHFVDFIDELVKTGRYSSASDAIRAGLRLLEREEEQLTEIRARIAASEEDIKAGKVYEVNDAFWDQLDREVDNRIKRGEKPAAHVIP